MNTCRAELDNAEHERGLVRMQRARKDLDARMGDAFGAGGGPSGVGRPGPL